MYIELSCAGLYDRDFSVRTLGVFWRTYIWLCLLTIDSRSTIPV